MLKDAQKSEQMADLLAGRMQKQAEPMPMSEEEEKPAQEGGKPSVEIELDADGGETSGAAEDLLKGLTENDKQQLLSSKPKSITDRLLRDILMKQQGESTKG